jgi:hypothetical protein
MPAKGKTNRKPRSATRPRNGSSPVAVAPPANADPSRYAVTAWNSGRVELRLPSGQLCLVQRMSIAKMAEEGIIDNFDSLTSLVQDKHVAKKSRSNGAPRQSASDLETEIMMRNLMKHPERLKDAMDIMDRVVMAVVVQPEILPVPEDGMRKDGAAYIDWVDEEDKSYVMNFAFGGSRDLERFRREFAESSASVDDVANVEEDAE